MTPMMGVPNVGQMAASTQVGPMVRMPQMGPRKALAGPRRPMGKLKMPGIGSSRDALLGGLKG